MTMPDDDDYKYISTKRRVYRLPKDARGTPIDEIYPGVELPAFLKGALVYDTPRGPIIARQDSGERDGSMERKEDGSTRSEAIGEGNMVTRQSAAGHAEPPAKAEPRAPERQDDPMRFFRKDALARGDASKARNRRRNHDRDEFER
jgi:hypothetical protein